MCYSKWHRHTRKKEFRVLLSEVEPKILATGDQIKSLLVRKYIVVGDIFFASRNLPIH